MDWYSLYDKYLDMPDHVLRASVISLSDIGLGSEVADIITNIENAEIKLRLIEKSIRLDATFSENDYARLEGEIPADLLVKLAKYGNMEFGMSEMVTEALENIVDENVKMALYERAYIEDVKFSKKQLDRIGYKDIDSAHDAAEDTQLSDTVRKGIGCGCLGVILGLGIISKLTKKYSDDNR